MFDRRMAKREGSGWLDIRLFGRTNTAPIIRDEVNGEGKLVRCFHLRSKAGISNVIMQLINKR